VELIDPASGRRYFKKCRRRYDEPGQARELTFSCYRRFQFLSRERTRLWFVEALEKARRRWPFDLWAYVVMPEHVHLIVYPRAAGARLSGFLQGLKEPVARQALAYLRCHAPEWLPRLTVREGKRERHRFWQPGGGYDRNVFDPSTAGQMIDYLHANPVRRGLVERPEDWPWSSARWFAGIRPVPIEMDASVLEYVSAVPGVRGGTPGGTKGVGGCPATPTRFPRRCRGGTP
jgi:putative transposase